MKGDHYCLLRRGGQLPRVKLMVAPRCKCRGGFSIVVMSSLGLSLPLGRGWLHFSLTLHLPGSSENETCVQWILIAPPQRIINPPGLAMPRERGKPRHGPAWYSLAARQRRVQRLERTLSIAQTQHWERPRTPPMAYVEEEILEEPIQVPPESLLFTFPG
jgi:hypothetical protein